MRRCNPNHDVSSEFAGNVDSGRSFPRFPHDMLTTAGRGRPTIESSLDGMGQGIRIARPVALARKERPMFENNVLIDVSVACSHHEIRSGGAIAVNPC